MSFASPSTARTGSWRATFGLLALALAIRGAALLLVPDALSADPDSYRRLAENVLRYHCFGKGLTATAYRPPLYPLALAPCLALGGSGRVAIGVLHLVMGLATVWLVERLGRRWGLGNYAILAAVLVAADPILVRQSTLVMTETMAALLACLGLVALVRACERLTLRRAAAAGVSLGLGILCRPTFLVFSLLAVILLPFAASGSGTKGAGEGSNSSEANRWRLWRKRLPVPLAFLAATALVLAPWVIRNQRELGRPIIGTSHGGYTLLLGNNPQFYQYLRFGPWGRAWDAEEFFRDWSRRVKRAKPVDERAADKLAYEAAWETIRNQPGMFLYSCLVRAGRLWAPLPHQVAAKESLSGRLARYAVAAWYLLEFALAAVGLVVIARSCLGLASAGDRPRTPSPSTATPLAQGEKGEAKQPCKVRETHRSSCPQPPAPCPLPTAPRPLPIADYLWPVLLAASFTAVHSLYWSDIRMRAPLMSAVALVAARGLARLICCFRPVP